jgi:heme o synthase
MINYYLITKPGIVLGNLVTVAAGFLLASKGNFDPWLFLATLIGIVFIMASACVFNNYIDRELDKKMSRTKNRALVTGLISGRKALLFGLVLEIVGTIILLTYTNLLTTIVAGLGFFVYVILYSLWKSKTVYGTAIGSIAGAVPPVVGYCAVSNQFDSGALILFAMLVFWQMPHFFAIAMFHLEDYKAAKIPVLPLIKGTLRTKIHMVLYIIAFIFTALMLTYYNYTGYTYLSVAVLLGSAWLGLSLLGFKNSNEQAWGRQMFRLSLVLILGIALVIPFDTV